MTDKLKTLAEEAKRFDGGDWFLFQHLIDHWSMDKQDAAYIAAVSPDVVLGLLAERDALRAEVERVRRETVEDWVKKKESQHTWLTNAAAANIIRSLK